MFFFFFIHTLPLGWSCLIKSRFFVWCIQSQLMCSFYLYVPFFFLSKMLSCIFSVCFYASFLLKWKWSYVTSELTVLRAQRFPVDFTDECKLSWVWPEDVKKLRLLSHSEMGRWCFRPEEAEHPLLQWKTSRFNFGYVTVCVVVASLYCCSKCWRRLIWCLCEI